MTKTIRDRVRLVRRFTEFAESYPWAWGPGDVEDFTVSLASGGARRAPSTIRGYHLALRMFCDYLTDARYGWPRLPRPVRLVPSQVCHEWNTVAHLNEYEGRPARRPLTYGELQDFFDHLDDQVDRAASSGRKGALARCATRRSSRPPTRSGYAATSCAAWTWPTCDPTRTCPGGAPTARSTSATARPSAVASHAAARSWRSRVRLGDRGHASVGRAGPAVIRRARATRPCG